MTTTTTPDTSDWVLTTIPFSGFYETVHSAVLEDELNSTLADDTGEPYQDLVDKAQDLPTNYKVLREQYAQHYALALCGAVGIPEEQWVFDKLSSPREYNFTTDRVFIKLHPAVYNRLVTSTLLDHDATDAFIARCGASFTSRDGFISYYDPDYTTWGRPDEWDSNQVGVLFEAHCCHVLDWGHDCVDQYEYEAEFAFDTALGNGHAGTCVDSGYKAAGEQAYAAWIALCDEAYDRRTATAHE